MVAPSTSTETADVASLRGENVKDFEISRVHPKDEPRSATIVSSDKENISKSKIPEILPKGKPKKKRAPRVSIREETDTPRIRPKERLRKKATATKSNTPEMLPKGKPMKDTSAQVSVRKETDEEAETDTSRGRPKDRPRSASIHEGTTPISIMSRLLPKDRHKNSGTRVSFSEEFNTEVEVPRVNKKYRKKCWITHDEVQHNMMMFKIRGMVQDKLVELLANDEKSFADNEETEATETDITEASDDSWQSQGQESEQEQEQGQKLQQQESEEKQRIPMARKNRILQHLLDAIMERRKEDIYSFLTSKCTISFNMVKK
jgi:hypothetical protein